ncbi:MAG: quinone-dependent dihydroorotate dehydrogenase [Rhodospirillales bacterium]|nr:quinone-dependent dihydroorotate dehydrogenase [Rhodospirillales bacterium]
MLDPYLIAGPLLRSLPPETAHRLAIHALRLGLTPAEKETPDPILACEYWGLKFANPIGLSAGFDKDAEGMDAALRIGFGFAEAGTVTPLPQPGNPKPRLFRLPEDRAVINRLGFNSGGLARFAGRFAKRDRANSIGPTGANVGRNKLTDEEHAIADFEIGVEALADLADYLVINISSPNTPGLRSLQKRAKLEELIGRCLEARARGMRGEAAPPPLLVKIAPDLDEGEKRDIAELALETDIAGLIVCNTTIDRPSTLKSRYRDEAGGLSGAPLFDRAREFVAETYEMTRGQIPIIGCGGVGSGDDAYAMIRAGASLIQLYSALVFEGPGLIPRIKKQLADRLRQDGFGSVGAAIGADHG